MFKNNLNPPQSPSHNIMFKPNATMITMTADDATMKVISWNHAFPSQVWFGLIHYSAFSAVKAM